MKTLYVARETNLSTNLFPATFNLTAETLTPQAVKALLNIDEETDVQVRRVFDLNDSTTLLSVKYCQENYDLDLSTIEQTEDGTGTIAVPGDAVLLMHVDERLIAGYTVGQSSAHPAVTFQVWGIQEQEPDS